MKENNYNEFLEKEKYVEDNISCPFCSRELIGTSPFDLIFICPGCGEFYSYDFENNELIFCITDEK